MSLDNISNNKKLNKAELNSDIMNIKSNFILQKIFRHKKKNKLLEFMKYNKKLQKRLNTNIKDYKEYSQLYTFIEVELKLKDNKYGQFINVSQRDRYYYHIYFDDSNKEIKRHHTDENEKVKTIKIIIDYQVNSFQSVFAGHRILSSIFFKKFYRINITDMSYMFDRCKFLKKLNLSYFKTIISYLFVLLLKNNL